MKVYKKHPRQAYSEIPEEKFSALFPHLCVLEGCCIPHTLKVAYDIQRQIRKSPVEEVSMEKLFSFQPQRRAMPKYVQTTAQLHSSHMLAK